ncbi:glycosyltransferase family 9 protein [Martelella alba]|uniref:Glycosyltransferase family 9 protein n=1 Tax=Martelella alba TaxID=2590451 RepID=A0ABY2SGK1_9HYPH|nr:glycosyltransferase family 9 protein [Martelella alba]TKI04022.1 glycosyltransferase family 9 protein [Martelella alba]
MKKNKIRLVNFFLTLYTPLFGRLKPAETLNAQAEFDSIVVFSTTALGDLLFNTPAIHALRRRYPKARLTLVSSHKNRSMVAGSPDFDNIIYWNSKINRAYDVIKALRPLKPQLSVILHSHMPYDILIAILAGSHYVMRDNYAIDSPLMNHWLAAYSAGFQGHIIQRKLQLLKVLGCDTDDIAMRIPCRFQRLDKEPGYVDIGFQMGTSEKLRQWPVYRFAELARAILALEGDARRYRIVLIGSDKETGLADELLQRLNDRRDSVRSLVGKTDLRQLVATIANLDWLVTGDTGPLHVAVALQVRTVSLFVTANPHHTGPLQDPDLHTVIHAKARFDAANTADNEYPLSVIRAQEVFEPIEKAMKPPVPSAPQKPAAQGRTL